MLVGVGVELLFGIIYVVGISIFVEGISELGDNGKIRWWEKYVYGFLKWWLYGGW